MKKNDGTFNFYDFCESIIESTVFDSSLFLLYGLGSCNHYILFNDSK